MIVGFDDERGTYLQHYFDSLGVARVDELSFADGVWELLARRAGFFTLDSSQRFTGMTSRAIDVKRGAVL